MGAARTLYTVLLLAGAASLCINPVSCLTPQELDTLRARIGDVMHCGKVPGMAVGIIHKGQVVLTEGFGIADRSTMRAVDSKTLFGIGSTTKAMTATLVNMLHDEQKLNIDGSVTDYFPRFKLFDNRANSLATVRDLLAHRTGLPRYDEMAMLAPTMESMVLNARYFEPAAPIRTEFLYNNIMYAAAGMVAENVEAEEWGAILKHRIFDPLGMTDSVAHYKEAALKSNVAIPQDLDKNGDFFNIDAETNQVFDVMGPAGSVNSNVEDMLKWIQFNLDQGKLANGTQRLKAKTLQDMQQPSMFNRYMGNVTADMRTLLGLLSGDYGMGWMSGTYKGRYRVFHNGATFGFHTLVSLFPDDDFGYVILSNPYRLLTNNNDILGGIIADMVLQLDVSTPSRAAVCNWPCSVWPDLPGMCPSASSVNHQAVIEAMVPSTGPARPVSAHAETYTVPQGWHSGLGADGPAIAHFVGNYSQPAGMLRVWVQGTTLHASLWNGGIARIDGTLIRLPGTTHHFQFLGYFKRLDPENPVNGGRFFLVFEENFAGDVVSASLRYPHDTNYDLRFTTPAYNAREDGSSSSCGYAGNGYYKVTDTRTVGKDHDSSLSNGQIVGVIFAAALTAALLVLLVTYCCAKVGYRKAMRSEAHTQLLHLQEDLLSSEMQ